MHHMIGRQLTLANTPCDAAEVSVGIDLDHMVVYVRCKSGSKQLLLAQLLFAELRATSPSLWRWYARCICPTVAFSSGDLAGDEFTIS